MSDALDLMRGLVLEDGRRWGDAAVDVQLEDARSVLDGTVSNHLFTRSRGFSKTTDNAGLLIPVMLTQAPPRARLYGLAADRGQGQLLVDALAGFLSRTPELQGALELREWGVVAPRTGAKLEILPADQASIWGLRPYFVICDEIAQWLSTGPPQRCWEAVSTAVVKTPGSRLVVLTTAGDPAHWSWGILEHARDDPLWQVHEVPGPAPWIDEKRLAGEKRRLPESLYRRLFLNEWTASDDRLADEGDLAACTVLDGPLEPKRGVQYVIGLDIGLKNDATVAAVCHAEKIPGAEHPRVVLDRMGYWKGSRLRPLQLSVVETWVEEVARRYGRARARFDPYQAIHLAQRLKARGISVQEFTFGPASVGKLATVLLQLIREHALALPDDPDLIDELRNVRVRESSPGVFRMDHDRGRHDDRAIALALAASLLVEKGTPRRMRTFSAFNSSSRPRRNIESEAAMVRDLRSRGVDVPSAIVPGAGW